MVHAYPGLYHRVHGRWVATRMLHHGDVGLFTLKVRIDNPPGPTPRAHLRLRRLLGQGRNAQYDGTVYRVGMNHAPLPKGYTRFSVEVPFRAPQWHGFFVAEFEVTNGHILAVPFLRFTLRHRMTPHHRKRSRFLALQEKAPEVQGHFPYRVPV